MTTTASVPAKDAFRGPYTQTALVFQGGGALGAYQAGVYQALAEADARPIGSPASRSERSTRRLSPATRRICGCRGCANSGNSRRPRFAGRRSTLATICGARSTTPAPCPLCFRASPDSSSPASCRPPFAATRRCRRRQLLRYQPLQTTLERLVDFDRINAGRRGSASAPSTCVLGNFVYFDTRTHKIRAEHVMASGALPPGFPADRDRGRALLGWRPRLQHAAAVCAGDRPEPGHAGVPGRSLERARRSSAQHAAT